MKIQNNEQNLQCWFKMYPQHSAGLHAMSSLSQLCIFVPNVERDTSHGFLRSVVPRRRRILSVRNQKLQRIPANCLPLKFQFDSSKITTCRARHKQSTNRHTNANHVKVATAFGKNNGTIIVNY